ncbi:hypothetical protein V6N11_018522 [Hibiscus sabdariffa]|uniref:Uncharacterized protein n=1 Tax=Hibiscus sabdariffa TaxID=183260 RepID=A0ABR2T7L2_9ROSI
MPAEMSAWAGPVVSIRDIPFVILFKSDYQSTPKDVPMETNIDLVAVTEEATLEELKEPKPFEDMRGRTTIGQGSRKPNPTGVGAIKIQQKGKRPFKVLRVHDVFNTELSKSLHGDHEDPSRGSANCLSRVLLMGGAVLMGEQRSSIQSWEQAEVPWEFKD